MRISILQIIAALVLGFNTATVTSANIDEADYNEVVLLVSDVQSYYKAASVFIIYTGNDESLETTTILQQLQREFSHKFVPSLTLNYSDIVDHHNFYDERIIKPLFIVLIRSSQEVDWFRNLTANYDMSYATWIVIFTTSETLELCCRPVGNYFNLEFDTEMLVKCHGDPIIREWYSLHGDETKMYDLARWDSQRRLQLMTDKSLYERRKNLEGIVIPIVIVKESRAVEKLEEGGFGGYFASVLMELSSTLNFKVRIAYKEDRFGIYNKTAGQWTGAMSRLVRGEAEFGVSEFTMTAQRLDAVDFTLPILLTRNLLFFRQPDGSALNWSAYLNVYPTNGWIAIVLMFLVSFVVITYIRINIREKPLPPDYISQNCIQVWGILSLQGLPVLPKQSSMKIAYFSILLQSVVVYAVYSACLISYLAVSTPTLPFKDLEGYARDGSYQCITIRESSLYDLIMSASDDVMKKVVSLVPEPKLLPRTVTDSFKQVCAGKKAFFSDGSIKNLVNSQIPCDVVSIELDRIDSLAIAIKKNSNYRALINYHLLRFQDAGIMHRMRTQVYKKVSPADTKYDAVNLKSIFPLLVVLAAGCLASLSVLCVEIVVHRNTVKHDSELLSIVIDRIVITKSLMFKGSP